MRNGKSSLLLSIVSNRPIIANSLNRTAKRGFFARYFLFLSQRLLVDKRIVVDVGAAEIFRRRIATHIAIDARRIDVVSAGHVFLHTIVSIRQTLLQKCRGSPRGCPLPKMRAGTSPAPTKLFYG